MSEKITTKRMADKLNKQTLLNTNIIFLKRIIKCWCPKSALNAEGNSIQAVESHSIY